MSRVLNGNLIVLKWQNIRMVSNIKQRERESEREREREQNLVKQFTLHSAGTFQRLSKDVISLEVTVFTKMSILDV